MALKAPTSQLTSELVLMSVFMAEASELLIATNILGNSLGYVTLFIPLIVLN